MLTALSVLLTTRLFMLLRKFLRCTVHLHTDADMIVNVEVVTLVTLPNFNHDSRSEQ